MQNFLPIFARLFGMWVCQTGMNVKITITMIKVLVFDLGGVLLDLDLDACYKSCREKLGFERVDELVGPCHQ